MTATALGPTVAVEPPEVGAGPGALGRSGSRDVEDAAGATVLDVVVPVYNARGNATSRTLRQVARFAAIGVVSTLAYVVLYAALRAWLPAVASNAVALVVTAIGNTAANRRITFDVRGSERMMRDQLAGLAAFGIALAITTASIEFLHLVAPVAPRGVEVGVLVAANAVATVVRFLVLRRSIDRPMPVVLSKSPTGSPS